MKWGLLGLVISLSMKVSYDWIGKIKKKNFRKSLEKIDKLDNLTAKKLVKYSNS